jgi:catechol 2,3-dioxygenase-like lactoylglutathione lyase family enzyme
MTIAKLAHYSVRTHDLDASCRFYTQVLGLRAGYRPPFPFPGVWLYRDDDESEFGVVHLIGCNAADAAAVESYLGNRTREPQVTAGALDHVAFLATDWKALRSRCERHGVCTTERVVPTLGLRQVFLTDPSGVTIEMNYPAEEIR